jgi:hypothetical protein
VGGEAVSLNIVTGRIRNDSIPTDVLRNITANYHEI